MDLPTELILQIVSYLPAVDAMCLKLVNKRFYNTISASLAWNAPGHFPLMMRLVDRESRWLIWGTEIALPCYICCKFRDYRNFAFDRASREMGKWPNFRMAQSKWIAMPACLDCRQKDIFISSKFRAGEEVVVAGGVRRNPWKIPYVLRFCPGCRELAVRLVVMCSHCEECYPVKRCSGCSFYSNNRWYRDLAARFRKGEEMRWKFVEEEWMDAKEKEDAKIKQEVQQSG